MDFYHRFTEDPVNKNSFLPGEVWLLAVSGGVDSMVLWHLLMRKGVKFEVAHVNYGLRGKESDDDEQFVMKQAELQGLKCHVNKPESLRYAASRRISVQMAARELRYEWFDRLIESGHFAGLLTAHHATDNAETMLINLLRGGGLEGLKGISSGQRDILRPLLIFTREEIEDYAYEQKISFREDSTNLSDKYVRNKIRHHVLPVFKEINPAYELNFLKTANILKDAAKVMHAQAKSLLAAAEDSHGDGDVRLKINKIKIFPQFDVILYYLLNSYGANPGVYRDILHNLDSEPGAVFTTGSHKITHDRHHLVISSLEDEEKGFEFELTGPGHFDTGIGQFKVEKLARDQVRMTDSKQIALLDADFCHFPIQVRNWQTGDAFSPLGMTGTKLLSDFFTDEKVDSTRRNKIPVLLSEGKIIWVAGMRISHVHKISGKTQQVFRITWNPVSV